MMATPKSSNEKPKSLNLREVAELVGGEICGDETVAITGVSGIKEAVPGQITFLANSKYQSYLESTQASAVITTADVPFTTKPLVRTKNPSFAFSRLTAYFAQNPFERTPGIHPTAVIGKNVQLGKNVSIGAYSVIEDHSSIGDDTIVDAHAAIGRKCKIGKSCLLHAKVTLYDGTELGNRVIIHSGAVIGSDGFGYDVHEERQQKIPHIGCVKLEDDVEIGANTCIDRARLGVTLIKAGTKIDNLVQIAHNVVVGKDSLIVSQAGISGSVVVGEKVIIAGQAGLVGHIEVGDKAIVAARSGVTKSVAAGEIVLGGPAKPIQEQKRIFALIARLPELFKEFAELKKKIQK